MRFSIVVLSAFLLPAFAAPTPEAALEARGDDVKHHCVDGWHWDDHQKKCMEDEHKPTCKHNEYYDEQHKKCLPIHVPEPVKDCPKGMRYNPSTMKCYSPERHPSEENCKYLGKKYNAHEDKCEDWKPTCHYPEYYDEHEKKCVKPVKPTCHYPEYYDEYQKKCVKPVKPTCHYPEYYDEHEKKCVKPVKPTCHYPEYYDEHQKKCVKPAKPTCHYPEYYDEHAKKCVKPQHHCENPDQYWDDSKNKCEWKEGKCPKNMRYNPKTKKCYQPLNHPSKDNCEWAGKHYNEHEHKCY